MQMPVTSRPWKEKPPAEKWMVVGVFVGFFGGLLIAIFGRVDNKIMAAVYIVVGAVLGAVLLRIAYELFRRSRRSA
jgi:drug/metabolite transporter (DMT)-like permease